jgi:hypothetical protein
MDINTFLQKIAQHPEWIDFNETMAVIDANYNFTPTAFKNGEIMNEQGKNSGSCKLFSFARLNNLASQQTLYCFGNYYKDVLNNPDGNDHLNIRNFMKYGWEGVAFDGQALELK